MKRINLKALICVFIIFALLSGCVSIKPTDPFAQLDFRNVESIVVKSWARDLDATPRDLSHQFIITDRPTIEKLTGLLKDSQEISPYLPGIGCLSTQVFMDKKGRPLAHTGIVNFGSRIVITGPKDDDEVYRKVTYSKEFCRTIYDLMLQKSPEIIRRQQKHYKGVGESLEGLLFSEPKNRKAATTN